MSFNGADYSTKKPYHLEPIFLALPPDVSERRVVRQFLEALLFEKLICFTVNPRNTVTCTYSDSNAVFDKILTLKIGEYSFRAAGTIRAFDRVRLATGSIKHFVKNTMQWVETNLHTIVNALVISNPKKMKLQKELGQTLNLCRWNRKHLLHHTIVRRNLSFQSLESAITEGHLYHPCFKTRLGFSEQDHALYGPESANHFQLLWLAIKHQNIDSQLPQHESDFWQQEIGSHAYTSLSKALFTQNGNWQDYHLMPIHPWQYNAILPLGLRQLIAEKDILFLGKAGDFYQSSQSLRTLMNVSNPLKANIKLPMDIICTSSQRNLQSHFVHTAPVISHWLQQLLANDQYLQKQNNTILLSEYAGLLYEPQNHKQLQGLIGVIFRESALTKLTPGQSVVPFSALMLVESDDLPFINDWIEHYGIEKWLNQLLSTMLLPLWHLLVHQGVAFEAHSQNLLLIHRDGWPEKIVLRDFHEDTEFVVDFLKDPHNLPKLADVDPYFNDIPLDEGFAMANIDALRELFMDTVYVFNLADLAFVLERFYHLSDSSFWHLIQKQLTDYAASGITDSKRLQKVGADQTHIAVESLLKKKLMGGGVLDYYEHTVNNRLAQPLSQPLSHQSQAHQPQTHQSQSQSRSTQKAFSEA